MGKKITGRQDTIFPLLIAPRQFIFGWPQDNLSLLIDIIHVLIRLARERERERERESFWPLLARLKNLSSTDHADQAFHTETPEFSGHCLFNKFYWHESKSDLNLILVNKEAGSKLVMRSCLTRDYSLVHDKLK